VDMERHNVEHPGYALRICKTLLNHHRITRIMLKSLIILPELDVYIIQSVLWLQIWMLSRY